MTGRVYLDASAAVKLVVTESESESLRAFLAQQRTRLSSRIVAVEVIRAVARAKPRVVDEALDRARSILQLLEYVELDQEVAARAGGIEPLGLRSLDAIHLASAMVIGEDLDAFVTYDARQAAAAREFGLDIVSPS